MDILRSLETHSCVSAYEVQVYRHWSVGFYFKLKVNLIDGSELHAREYLDADERDYSFHWQTAEGQLISRWDNAPHHRMVATYPHHRHTEDGIIESTGITLDAVLEVIQSQLCLTPKPPHGLG
ncbi:DUF6516 family protein [Lamprobacter modestohalophilus]|uniref:toxin-antitoxin system TumE family protein n=1 Tax=Lamprobacter modestohalophilus TaxID=1064514 RepID=UPI001904FC17|nr:DUF6516 family protein [Lamprobacter modestohalophilus]MEA1052228.1 DUF6516 family protein [Lamprobacter modestohalophilus]